MINLATKGILSGGEITVIVEYNVELIGDIVTEQNITGEIIETLSIEGTMSCD